MKLRPRTFLLVGVTSAAILLAVVLVLPSIMLRSYRELERREARVNANRVATAIDETLSELGTKVADWASWDDTYRYIVDGNAAFERSNLMPATYGLLRVETIVFVNTEGRIVFGRRHDLATGREEPLAPDLVARLAPGSSLLCTGSRAFEHAGLLLLDHGPLLVVSRPILTSEGTGEPRGTVLFGRPLDPEEVKRLSRRTLLNVRLGRLDDVARSEGAPLGLRSAIAAGDSVSIEPIDHAMITANRVLRDIDGQPILAAEVEMSREILHQGEASVRTVIACVLIAMLLLGGVTILLIENNVLRRLTSLHEDVRRVHHSHNPSERVSEHGSDELGDLGRGVNAMLGAIEDSQRDLRSARDAAETANRAKTEFLATMSHEIRTPMNGVLGMTTLLLRTPMNHEQREYARLVHSSAESLLGLINDILDLSKLEADRVKLEALPFDLVELLGELGELMRGRATEAGIEVVVHVLPGAPRRVLGDSIRLRQVVLNLLGNALKFTERGSVTIELRDETPVGGTPTTRIAITDTGIGIPLAQQAELFTPFTQADASTTRRFGGSGLGLAISKRLVELMGGRIGLTSLEGQGSTFWVEVPLTAAPAADSEIRWKQPEEGCRVLVVDDLEVSGRALADGLIAGGVDVAAVTSGAAALAYLADPSHLPVHAIFVDLPLADLAPHAFLAALAANPKVAAIPRLMLTAHPQRGDGAAAEATGWAAYLTKPVRPHVLLAAVEATTRADSPRSGGIVTRHSLAEETHLAAPAEANTAEFAGIHVLVAEDNKVNQLVAKRMLESLGCSVDLAENGRKAVELVERGDVDLVFMDMHMPEMDGLEAAREIRALSDAAARVPIVALTASVLSNERLACLEAGMDAFVGKPVRPEELGQALRENLPDRKRRLAA